MQPVDRPDPWSVLQAFRPPGPLNRNGPPGNRPEACRSPGPFKEMAFWPVDRPAASWLTTGGAVLRNSPPRAEQRLWDPQLVGDEDNSVVGERTLALASVHECP